MTHSLPAGGRTGFLPAVQSFSLLIIAILALAATGATVLAALGVLPWIELAVAYGGRPVPLAGPALQVVLTVLLWALLAFLPASRRILALEASHRSFRMGVEDVARAYRACHEADQAGRFALESEFDAIRERYAFLRAHPDLGELEAEVLELAAEMSFEARDLADAFAEEKVARARDFLRQRKAQIAATQRRLVTARQICDELRRWLKEVETGENSVREELRELERDLLDLLPRLGFETEIEERPRPRPRTATKGGTVVPMQRDGAQG